MSSVDSFDYLFRHTNKCLHNCQTILSFIGVYYVGKLTFRVLRTLLRTTYSHVWPQIRPFRIDNSGHKWALITGGSDGVGKAFAEQLARRGLNLIIAARSETKIYLLAKHLTAKYGVKVSPLSVNFSSGSIEVYDMIAKHIADKEIAVLINNVGVMYDKPTLFLDLKREKLVDIINVNIVPVVMITNLVLPQMVSRKSGVIVNVSSLSAIRPLPLMTVYSASKVFIDYFSRGLAYEYRSLGITVQSLMPAHIQSPTSKYRTLLPFMSPTCETYAYRAINTIGFADQTTGYMAHQFQHWLYSNLPERVWYFSSWFALKWIAKTM